MSDKQETWDVTVTETVEYQVPVTAATADDAAERAIQVIVQADDPDRWFHAVTDRSAAPALRPSTAKGEQR